MARIRNIKITFFTNEDLAELPFETRLLFIGLWNLADRRGRLEDRPKRIKISLFPYDSVDVNESLKALESKGFLTRYKATLATGEALDLIQILKFEKHQRISGDEAKKESEYPAPQVSNYEEALKDEDSSDQEAIETFASITEEVEKKQERSSEEALKRADLGLRTPDIGHRTSNINAPIPAEPIAPQNTALVPKPEPKKPDKPKRTEFDMAIFDAIWTELVINGGLRFAKQDQGIHAKATWELVDKCVAQFGVDAIDGAKAIIKAFDDKKRADRTSGGFWRNMARNAFFIRGNGIWGQLLESLRTEPEVELEPEIAALIGV